MGLLDWLNGIRDTSVTDRGFKDATGSAGLARVVGIEQRLDDGTTKRYVAVAHGTRVSGIEIAHGPAAVVARLHLGAEVRVRVDGDKVLLDAPEVGQKPRRKPPAEGVTDKAVDWGDQRRHAAWLAAPGADVPVVVDGGRAVVDWAAAAGEPRPPGEVDDQPPPGSAAALMPY